jgi:hypothetical protein
MAVPHFLEHSSYIGTVQLTQVESPLSFQFQDETELSESDCGDDRPDPLAFLAEFGLIASCNSQANLAVFWARSFFSPANSIFLGRCHNTICSVCHSDTHAQVPSPKKTFAG